MNLNLQLLQTSASLVIFKGGFLIILAMLAVFLLVVYRQIRSMNTIVTQPDMFPYLEAFVFFLLASLVALFIVAVIVL